MNKIKYVPLSVAMSIVLYSFFQEFSLEHSLVALGFCSIYVFELYFSHERGKTETKELTENDKLKLEYEKEQLIFNISKVKQQQVFDSTKGATEPKKAGYKW